MLSQLTSVHARQWGLGSKPFATGKLRVRAAAVGRPSATQGFGPPGSQPRVSKSRPKGFGKKKQTQFAEEVEGGGQQEPLQAAAGPQAPPAVGEFTVTAPDPWAAAPVDRGVHDPAGEAAAAAAAARDAAAGPRPSDAAFAARLEAVRVAGEAKRRAGGAAAEGGSAASQAALPNLDLMPFAAAPVPPPPSLTTPSMASEGEEKSRIPPGWVRGIAVGAIAVFAIVYGFSSDLVASTSPVGVRSSSKSGPGALTATDRKALVATTESFAAAAAAAGGGGAQLTAAAAMDAGDAYRRLGNLPAAAGAYRAAYGTPDGASVAFEALVGEVDTLIEDKHPTEAAAAAESFSKTFGTELAAGKVPGMDTVDAQLLRARALLATGDPASAEDAMAVFDSLCAARPDDFRPLLARGLALRARAGPAGRSAEAERALIEARFLAPKGEARQAVDRAIKSGAT